jgi:hypothetical protein
MAIAAALRGNQMRVEEANVVQTPGFVRIRRT